MNIAITTGEPAGIGPEISLRAARDCAALQRFAGDTIVVLGDAGLLADRARALAIDVDLQPWTSARTGGVASATCSWAATQNWWYAPAPRRFCWCGARRPLAREGLRSPPLTEPSIKVR